MWLTLALLILGSAIAVLFSQEFTRGFKALFAIPAVALIVPIIAATALVVIYEPWLLWLLIKIKQALSWLIAQMASLLPFGNWATFVATMLLLVAAALLPMMTVNLWYRYKRYPPDTFPYLTGGFIWLFMALLLSVN